MEESEKNKMKHTNVLYAVLAMLCVATIASAYDPLGLDLPTSAVTLKVPGLAGPSAQIYITLSNVPAGFDVTNGQYLGWCADPNHDIWYPNVPYSARLYSSYDDSLPVASSGNWPEINYVVNKFRKGGFSSVCATTVTDDEIQTVIWSYLGYANVYGTPNPACMAAIKADVTANNGGSFVPTSGDVVGLVANNGQNVQVVFLELPYTTAPEVAGLAMAVAMISPAFGYLLVKRKK